MKRYVHAASQLDKPYKGIWYGAKTNPISVKELLDKVIQCNGRGFTVTYKRHYVGDKLLDAGDTEICLLDEERRGKFRLSPECVGYLKDNLPEGNWIRAKLIVWTEEEK